MNLTDKQKAFCDYYLESLNATEAAIKAGYSKKTGKKKNTLRFVKPTNIFKKVGNISVAGFSTAIGDLALGIICIFFNRQIMTHLGANALAVYGVTTQVTSFAQGIAYGAGQAAQPIISQNHGEPIFNKNSKSVICYENICRRILGEEIPFLTDKKKKNHLHFFFQLKPASRREIV